MFLTERRPGRLRAGQPHRRRVLRRGNGLQLGPADHRSPSRCSRSATTSHYYAVDHSPSYLWNSATWEISEALLPHLRTVLAGRAAWEADATIRRAIEIRDGVILNPSILSFQHRGDVYPHAVVSSGILH